ncbi:hypothetical protein SAMN06297358_4025 [Pedobacter xixiisoli]|uniref:Uncharacterized protein n=1 Tax=Pedobacter xixiisoli TaxID=1476464 RepID=A0A286AEI7_9SPHI|nr:hypothetical protein SAMN06297358_4025 [Pedobacter xixiisoli]
MIKKLSISIFCFSVIILSFYACKKDEPIEKRLTGTWELNRISFLETNVSIR